jgi:hypothetical protein
MDKALHDRIARVAYDLFERRGRRSGCEKEDWLEAEKIVRAELAAEMAAKRLHEWEAEAHKVAVKAEPKKPVSKKAAPAEAGKKAAKQPAKTSSSKKKNFPQAAV